MKNVFWNHYMTSKSHGLLRLINKENMNILICDIVNVMAVDALWPLLLTWINFNPIIDK